MKLFGQSIVIGGSYRPIDVEYNCVGVGEATVTLTLPFPGDNFRPAVFTWKKRCGSSPKPRIRVRGLFVRIRHRAVGRLRLEDLSVCCGGCTGGTVNSEVIVHTQDGDVVVEGGEVRPAWVSTTAWKTRLSSSSDL